MNYKKTLQSMKRFFKTLLSNNLLTPFVIGLILTISELVNHEFVRDILIETKEVGGIDFFLTIFGVAIGPVILLLTSFATLIDINNDYYN
jgi:hypothetical protein